jgi:hypothetical protein
MYGYNVSFNNLIHQDIKKKCNQILKFKLNLRLLQSMIILFKSIITIIIVNSCFKHK